MTLGAQQSQPRVEAQTLERAEEDMPEQQPAPQRPSQPSRLEPLAVPMTWRSSFSRSILPALLAGATGGLLIGLFFRLVTAVEAVSADGLEAIPIAIVFMGSAGLFVAVLGSVLAGAPGTAVALMLVKLRVARAAPWVGAVIGASLGAFAYGLFSAGVVDQGNDRLRVFMACGFAGCVGGLTGGLNLRGQNRS